MTVMDSVSNDINVAARALWKRKPFAISSVLTLAICLGSNALLFTVVNSVLLRPLPFPDADRLVLIDNSYPGAGVERAGASVPDFFDRLTAVDALTDQALYQIRDQSLGEPGSVTTVRGMTVTAGFFRVLGVSPLLGRAFSEGRNEAVATEAILSHGAWRSVFTEADVLGRTVQIDGKAATIIGVMPESFFFLDPDIRLWTRVDFTPAEKSDRMRHVNRWTNVGRLKAESRVEQAQAQVDAINAANLERFPQMKQFLANARFHTRVMRLQDDLVRDIKATINLLWGGAILVLLMGAITVANLVMIHWRSRQRELATRMVLGAGRARIVRLVLAECMLVATVGGLLGLLLAIGGLEVLKNLGIADIPRGSEIRLDLASVLFVALTVILTGVAAAVLPISQSARGSYAEILRGDDRTASESRGIRMFRRTMVVAQVGAAYVLLLSAGLLLESFRHVINASPGFDSSGVLVASVSLPPERYPSAPALRRFMSETISRIRDLPSVIRAGITTTIPLGGNTSESIIVPEGYQNQSGGSPPASIRIAVSPGYLEALGIHLLKGRLFDERDTNDSPRVTILDEQLAKSLWPIDDPIGRRVYLPGEGGDVTKPGDKVTWLTVIGIVEAVKLRDLAEGHGLAGGAHYFVLDQVPSRALALAIKTKDDSAQAFNDVRAIFNSQDSDLPVSGMQTMEQLMQKSLKSRQSWVLITWSFALIAFLLASLGLYGVLAYAVTQRTKEIGIRIALGSSPSKVFALVLREGMLLLVAGLGLGAGGLVVLSRALRSQLYEVAPTDPAVLTIVTSVFAVVALAACVIPAYHATRIEPVEAVLRQ